MSRQSVVRRRKNLLKKHPYCHWCGCKVIWYYVPGGHNNQELGKLPDNFATMDHINTKNEGPRPLRGELVLSCLRCNHDRGVADQAIRQIRDKMVPSIDSEVGDRRPRELDVSHITFMIDEYTEDDLPNWMK